MAQGVVCAVVYDIGSFNSLAWHSLADAMQNGMELSLLGPEQLPY
jgi:hypothetical protein